MRYLLSILIACSFLMLNAQVPHCDDEQFNQKVSSYMSGDINVIDVSIVQERQEKALILDAREYEEYAVSHIPGAVWVGYKDPNLDVLKDVPMDREIYIYCSVGYRSDKLGSKIHDKGWTNIYNVYGSIFEWANRSYPMVNEHNMPTDSIHTYNRKWSKWMNNEKMTKVY